MSNLFLIKIFVSLFSCFRFSDLKSSQRAAECKHSNENETIMYRMVENYFTEMIATELKCYILLQLAYFTQASEVG